jgi:hypothetical protein
MVSVKVSVVGGFGKSSGGVTKVFDLMSFNNNETG